MAPTIDTLSQRSSPSKVGSTCRCILLYICVAIFGISTWLPSNAIWLETPILWTRLVEGTNITGYIVHSMLSGFVMSLLYVSVVACVKGKCNEVPYICLSLMVQIICLLLIAVAGDKTNYINNRPHSLLFVICIIFISLGCCFSAIANILFASKLRPSCTSAVMFGEYLGYLLPYLIALAQGVGTTEPCPEIALEFQDLANFTHHFSRRSLHSVMVATTKAPPAPLIVRFDARVYFLVQAAVVAMSGVAFVYVCYGHVWNIPMPEAPVVVTHEQVESSAQMAPEDSSSAMYDGGYMLDDGTYRHGSPSIKSEGRCVPQQNEARAWKETYFRADEEEVPSGASVGYAHGHGRRWRGSTSTKGSLRSFRSDRTQTSTTADSVAQKDGEHPRHFILLMVIVFWANVIFSGPLAPTKAFACIPVNNVVFQAGVLLVNVFQALAALCTLKFNYKTKLTLIIAFSALGTILLAYVVALMAFSHAQESRDAPIFRTAGEFLATVAWAAIGTLFAFSRTGTAILCRFHGSAKTVTWFAGVSQFGRLVGSLFMIEMINICQVYRSFELDCSEDKAI